MDYKNLFNNEVIKLQKKLKKLSFDCGKIDGYLGGKTLIALKNYQKNVPKSSINKSMKSDLQKEELDDLNKMGTCKLAKTLENCGFSYNINQDLYYSLLNPWQRNLGYCHIYDELSLYFGMVIDCEPIFFEYSNSKWMIELWKGQYCLSTGCEIGVYKKDINKDFLDFYNCIEDNDLLNMSCKLKKNSNLIAERNDKHWWLTCFKPGVFSEPNELLMEIEIEFLDSKMCEAFINGLKNAGYKSSQIHKKNSSVYFVFEKIHTSQPKTQSEKSRKAQQRINKRFCKDYQNTKNDLNLKNNNPCISVEKILKNYPELEKQFLSFGKINLLNKFDSLFNF
jgi:hypothetical protein